MPDTLRTMTLSLDEEDYRAVQQAIAWLQRQRDDKGCSAIPEGESCTAGGAIAEACRGYLDMLGQWGNDS